MIAPASRRMLLLLGIILANSSHANGGEAPSRDVTTPPAYDTFLVIPIRLHVLTATELPELDCRLTDADLARILRKVNGIWNKAGIHWGLESIIREPAAQTSKFRLIRDLVGSVALGRYAMIVPEETRLSTALNVYYIHKFPVNGVWLGEDFAIVQETAQLRPVDGGIDEPIPRVTAHELGHALGLAHRQDRTNLLASGTTGTLLNTEEVATARGKALEIEGTLTIEALRKKVEDAKAVDDQEGTRRLSTWLAEIPGHGGKDPGAGRDPDPAGTARRETKPADHSPEAR